MQSVKSKDFLRSKIAAFSNLCFYSSFESSSPFKRNETYRMQELARKQTAVQACKYSSGEWKIMKKTRGDFSRWSKIKQTIINNVKMDPSFAFFKWQLEMNPT
jgi:hypothetical protein